MQHSLPMATIHYDQLLRHCPVICEYIAPPCSLIISISIYGQCYICRSLEVEVTAEAHHGLGALFFNSGRMKEAKAAFEHLLNIDPDNMEGACGYVSANRYLVCLGLSLLLSSF